MTANALRGDRGAVGGESGASAAGGSHATNRSTDEAVQASLARLSRLMESAREQVVAAARLEVAAEDRANPRADPAVAPADETAAVADPGELAAPELQATAPNPAPRVRAMSAAAAALLDDPASFVADRVAAATAELEARLRTTYDARLDELSGDLAQAEARLDAAEQGSRDAIEELGRQFAETSRVAGDARSAEYRGAEAVEGLGAEVARISESIEARFSRSEADQAGAWRSLDEKLGRVAERLAERIGGTDWRSARANEEMGEALARACERLSRDLIERVELGEERTVAMFIQSRDGIAREVEGRFAAPAEAGAEESAASDRRHSTVGDSSAPVALATIDEWSSPTKSADTGPTVGFLPALSPLVSEPAEPNPEPEADLHDLEAAGPAIAQSALEDMPAVPAKTGFWRGFGLTKSGTAPNP